MQVASAAKAIGLERKTRPDGFRLSLVIPAYNERETIRQAIREAETALSAIAADYEILVVDDGSTDGTADLVRVESWTNPHVRLVQHPRNLGYGAALRSGFQAATLDLVAFTDADCQFNLHDLEYMLPLSERYDITCGYRINRQDAARRRFVSWGYNTLISLLLGSQVHDLDCALKIFHREQLAEVLPESKNFFVNTEILAKARLQGLSVVEVGVHHRPRAGGKSKISLSDIPRTFATLLRFWWSRLVFPAPNTPATRPDGGLWAGFLVLALFAGLLLFPNLSYPLVEPDEGRYAEIAREMLQSGDWIVPTLHHQPYCDKPPLFHWLVAASFGLFGIGEASARLVPAVAALLTVLVTFILGRRILGTRLAFLAGLALLLMPGFTLCGRILIIDSVLSLFVAISLFTAYLAIQGERFHWSWWIASAVACAFGVLTKGPVALVLFLPPVAACLWLNRELVRPRWSSCLVYAGLVLVLVLPWYAAITIREPSFAYHFFIDQHLVRFFTGEYHDESFWYYVPVLMIACLPWSLLVVPLVRFFFSRSAALGRRRPQAMGFFLLWAGWCILFFSLSRGKLPPYILPATPALAMMLGCFLDRVACRPSSDVSLQRLRAELPHNALVILSGTWLVVSIGAGLLHLMGFWEVFGHASLAASCLAALALWRRKVPLRAAWAACCLLGTLLILELTHALVPAWSQSHSVITGSERITRLMQDGQVGVVCYGGEWGSIPFYAGRDDNFFNFSDKSPAELLAFLSQYSRYLIVVRQPADIERFRASIPAGMAMIHLADAGQMRVVLVQAVVP